MHIRAVDCDRRLGAALLPYRNIAGRLLCVWRGTFVRVTSLLQRRIRFQLGPGCIPGSRSGTSLHSLPFTVLCPTVCCLCTCWTMTLTPPWSPMKHWTHMGWTRYMTRMTSKIPPSPRRRGAGKKAKIE